MEYEEKNEEFQRMFAELVTLAKNDGTITESEAEVLSMVELSLNRFEAAVNQALEDGVITDAERLMLDHMEGNILQRVFDLIEKDEKLDDDAKKLVETLFDVVMDTLDES